MRFRHPAAAAVLAPFRHEQHVGVVAEFAPGLPLPQAANSMTATDIIGAFRQCLAVLFAGQRAGFMHRSLRPSRIIVSSLGRVVLLGFGEPDWLIRLHRCEKGPSEDFYVAPEEAAGGQNVDARSDFFALCRIFLEILLGRRPEPGETVAVPAGYPDGFLELLLRGIQGEPGARCRSLAEVIHEVDRWLSDGIPTLRRPAGVRVAA
jgi:serine/threonine protein kinase